MWEIGTLVCWATSKYLVDTNYPDKQKIILVMDNLNTHAIAFLYKTFPAQEARQIAKNWRFTIPQSMEAGWTWQR